MTVIRRAGLVACAAILAAACVPARRAGVASSPPPAGWAGRLEAADALCATGRYTALVEARRIYAEALARPDRRADTAERYVRTSIAIGLREKSLGILRPDPAADPGLPAAAKPALDGLATWLELLGGLPCRIKGTPGLDRIGGRSLDGQLDWIRGRVPDIDLELGRAAGGDDLAAALRLALRREFGFKFADKLDPAAVRALHPGSRLLAFEAAAGEPVRVADLEALLAADPGFAEIHYFLGDDDLNAGRLLSAETHYLAALEKIPDSLSVLISLAKTAFQMEELEACLGWNDRALALLPTYRDALLGRSLALGYIGRSEEALETLGRLLELGTYSMGEGQYWTAWNLHRLGRFEEARRAIEAARVFLVGVAGVETLSGLIAYAQGRFNESGKDFRRALDLDPAESDAAYHLGRLCADRGDWLDSGVYFAGAAMTLEGKERGLAAGIAEIGASGMAPERKARLTARKEAQLAAVRATKATCQYNGAAGYHNAGSLDRALDLARQSAAHPAFAERAAALIRLIRDGQARSAPGGSRIPHKGV
ncbi:MAG TPA: hypothetical protein P5119_04785 [Candidatus Aminicenantes bacterium]|nr:hypothetical protein [Candidatus Aminicenantes bacterium]HRY64642.1 hypothetical protein [Candidatus Aminicenantes bacterium]HRZ71555.1 hypothetical protein [Candidatus Aminicenantes bacterium]